MQKFDGILNGEDVNGLVLIHLVDDGRERGGLAGAGWTGDQDNAVANVADFLELIGEMQIIERRNVVGNDTHDDGATAALMENVDAETAAIFQAIGNVGGAFGFQFLGGVFVVADNGPGDLQSVVNGEAFQALVFQFDELAADFDLGGAAGRENEIADLRIGLQHGRNHLRNVNGAMNRRYGRCRSAGQNKCSVHGSLGRCWFSAVMEMTAG